MPDLTFCSVPGGITLGGLRNLELGERKERAEEEDGLGGGGAGELCVSLWPVPCLLFSKELYIYLLFFA